MWGGRRKGGGGDIPQIYSVSFLKHNSAVGYLYLGSTAPGAAVELKPLISIYHPHRHKDGRLQAAFKSLS